MAHFSSQLLKWSRNKESTQMPIHLYPSCLANSEDNIEIYQNPGLSSVTGVGITAAVYNSVKNCRQAE